MKKAGTDGFLSSIVEGSVGEDSGNLDMPNRGGGDAAIREVKRIAGDDSKKVVIWKFALVLVITVAGALVSVGINLYLKHQQQKEVDDSFDLFANTIADVSQLQFRALFDSMRGFSRSVTTETISQNASWPFVTIPQFEVFGKQAREGSGVDSIALTPFVSETELRAYNIYSQKEKGWIQESQRLELEMEGIDRGYEPYEIAPFVYDVKINFETGETAIVPTIGAGPHSPVWQLTPPPASPFLLMSNTMRIEEDPHPAEAVFTTEDTVISAMSVRMAIFADTINTPARHAEMHSENPFSSNPLQPHAPIVAPVFDSFDRSTRKHVGNLIGLFTMETFLVNLVPERIRGIYLVVENTCSQTFTFKIDGNRASYLGEGDLSDPHYRRIERTIVFDSYYEDAELQKNTYGSCVYSFRVVPSAEFEEVFDSNLPAAFAIVVAAIFLFMTITFLMYDRFVTRRNDKVMGAAVRSTAIVSSLFPSQVRDRLYAGIHTDAGTSTLARTSTARLKNFVDKGEGDTMDEADSSDDVVLKSQPIADLFPDTTVMFADIAGFTAWSSVREPSQVFTLLETVYRAFDRIAKQRRVFKVETVGDCYVAVTGCPDPMKNHCVVMARFALDCIQTMDVLTKRLETKLGPDTGDLNVRIGLHSGAVTAGVLRGERARFQLFGDTMNTAARMESTGQKGRIQLSEETAELLVGAGKQHWLLRRSETVYAKGKGSLKTYWLIDERESSESKSAKESSHVEDSTKSNPAALARQEILGTDSKTGRLIKWNVDVLLQLLKQVVARRISCGSASTPVAPEVEAGMSDHTGSVIDEVKEIIALPKFDPSSLKHEQDAETMELDPSVESELQIFVSCIASMYRENSFHNFEHASHVTMSVAKLLSRIVAPTDEICEDQAKGMAASMHDHTYGITSDPLTQFACVLSALIHDADHPGVPNAQLVKENNQLAVFYDNHSVAEQNSVDLAWNLLMDDNFKNLRAAIYGTQAEMKRFRQLVVNSVMATDIVDKELKALRNGRWDRAFSERVAENQQEDINRKATIVIEHLIQASDVAHTMQHWHIYRKWNERFFMECYQGYKAGRGGANNPADGWYAGELGFFDFYIIPLAKKLKECGVFGVASDEYLAYAVKNRQEWEARGQEIVASMVDSVNKA